MQLWKVGYCLSSDAGVYSREIYLIWIFRWRYLMTVNVWQSATDMGWETVSKLVNDSGCSYDDWPVYHVARLWYCWSSI